MKEVLLLLAYSVTVTNTTSNCVESKDFNISSPTEINTNATVTNILCNGDQNGAINLSIDGGNAPYTLTWANNQLSGDSIFGLEGGIYTIFIEDANGCVSEKQVEVQEPIKVEAFIETTEDSYLINESITFENASLGYTSSSWNLGDGTTSLLESPMHSYSQVGEYEVTLTLSNDNNCRDTTSKTITINGITVNVNNIIQEVDPIELIQLNNQLLVKTSFENSRDIVISIKNSIGQSIQKDIYAHNTTNQIFTLEAPKTTGLYLISISQHNELLKSYKIVK